MNHRRIQKENEKRRERVFRRLWPGLGHSAGEACFACTAGRVTFAFFDVSVRDALRVPEGECVYQEYLNLRSGKCARFIDPSQDSPSEIQLAAIDIVMESVRAWLYGVAGRPYPGNDFRDEALNEALKITEHTRSEELAAYCVSRETMPVVGVRVSSRYEDVLRHLKIRFESREALSEGDLVSRQTKGLLRFKKTMPSYLRPSDLSINNSNFRDYEKVAAAKPADRVDAESQAIGDDLTGIVSSLRERVERLEASKSHVSKKLAATEDALHKARTALNSRPTTPAEESKQTFSALRARIHWLEGQISDMEATSGSALAEPEWPTTWDDLEEFAAQHLGDRVVLTKRAIKAARQSRFQNIPLAYKVLYYLARDYVPACSGNDEARARLRHREAELGLTSGPTGEALFNKKYKDQYKILHLGKSLMLDRHIQGSSSRDPALCFRLYFAIAGEGEGRPYAVVGSFPAHMDNYDS